MDLEHPEITQIRKTGYPTRQPANNNQEYVDYTTREDDEQMDLNETLSDMVALEKTANAAYQAGFIDFKRDAREFPIVQMTDEAFKEYANPNEVEIKMREDKKIPFELSFEYEGVRFLTIMTEKEYSDFYKEEK